MDDSISRQKVIDTIYAMYEKCDTHSIEDYRDLLIESIEVLPSAQSK